MTGTLNIKKRYFLAFACILLSLVVVLTVVLQSNALAVEENGKKVATNISKEDAISIAKTIVGIEEGKYSNINVISEELQKTDDVPFLNLSGRLVWRVSFHNIHITIKTPQKDKNEYTLPWHKEDGGIIYENKKVTRLDVLVDQVTGKVINLSTSQPAGIEKKDEFNTENHRDWQVSTNYEYKGLPEKLPSISFMEALQSAQEGTGGVTDALQIEAYYVLVYRSISKETVPGFVSCRDDGPCPRWIIILKYLNFKDKPGRWTHDPTGKESNFKPTYGFYLHQINPESGDWIDSRMKLW